MCFQLLVEYKEPLRGLKDNWGIHRFDVSSLEAKLRNKQKYIYIYIYTETREGWRI